MLFIKIKCPFLSIYCISGASDQIRTDECLVHSQVCWASSPHPPNCLIIIISLYILCQSLFIKKKPYPLRIRHLNFFSVRQLGMLYSLNMPRKHQLLKQFPLGRAYLKLEYQRQSRSYYNCLKCMQWYHHRLGQLYRVQRFAN